MENKPVGIGGEFQSALEVSGAGARAETSIKKRARPVHDDLGGIEIVFRAEAMAIRARAVRRIKTEGARLELRNGDSTIGAGEFFRKDGVFCAGRRKDDHSLRHLSWGGTRMPQARRH